MDTGGAGAGDHLRLPPYACEDDAVAPRVGWVNRWGGCPARPTGLLAAPDSGMT